MKTATLSSKGQLVIPAQSATNLDEVAGCLVKAGRHRLSDAKIRASIRARHVLFDAVSKEFSSKVDDIRCHGKTGGCFIKGTRVHTKDGLKPIEEIKVGDYVLSSPEDGTGSPEYKRVVNTFVFEEKTIRDVQIFGPDSGTEYFLGSTGNHPFWVEGVGWTAAELLKKGNLLRKADGTFAEVARQKLVYRTEQDGVGWINNLSGDIRTSYGSIFDYANYKIIPRGDKDHYLAKDVYESDDPFLKVNVYNLEVEDFHTYYVAAQGFWVHDTN